MFFTQKQLGDESPELTEPQDIFNFDDEFQEDDSEQYNLRVLEKYDSEVQYQSNVYDKQEKETQFKTQTPSIGLFGIHEQLNEDSDNEAIDSKSQNQMEEMIKNHKQQKQLRPQISNEYIDDLQIINEQHDDNKFLKKIIKNYPSKQGLELYVPDSIKDIRAFLNTPIPEGSLMQCTIERQKSGMDYFYPKYNLMISENDQYLMSAKKMSLQRTSYYLLTLDKNQLFRKSPSFLGKLRSNFLGTEFIIFDQGENPDKTEHLENTRQQLGLILYQSNITTSLIPRRMSAIIPKIQLYGPSIFKPLKNTEGIKREIKQKLSKEIFVLFNKLPILNPKTKQYSLKFSPRVDRPSVKNFQLIHHDENDVILQFGKCGDQRYNLDFQHPLTPLQAFSICITAFDHKIACE